MRKKHALIEAHGPEILEARIAPASLVSKAVWKTGNAGEVFELHAGEGLSTAGDKAGAYLLFVEKGNALVFTTDFNNNGVLDENEITGIAAGDGLRLVLFTDVHGDIVTNLREQVIAGTPVLTLSDSNNNPADDPHALKGDGRILLNNRIEKIEMRTLTVDDLPDQNQDGLVNEVDVNLRAAATSFSIFGNIYAGRGFGVATDSTSGLIIDSTGSLLYPKVLLGATEVHPTIGSIKVGTAASGEWFNFGVSNGDDTAGTLQRFNPAPGQKGADIAYVRAANALTMFNLNSLVAGDGGAGAAGGDIVGVTLNADNSGGYEIIAGNGGRGANGGKGGSILNFSDLGSQTGKVYFKSGSGGTGTTGVGGDAGDFGFQTMNIFGFVNIELGDGGSGFTAGGNGASLLTGDFTQTVSSYQAGAGTGTTHMPDMSRNPETGEYEYRANIGTQHAIDFNNDGSGDYVYTTVGTSQLVVVLGGQTERIYLSGVRNAEALTVGDLNGDGHPDIAVGSSDAANRSGIVVFLSRYEDLNGDGVVDSTEDLNGNGQNDFLGFYEGRFSTLPQLNGFDPDPDVLGGAYETYTAQPSSVGSIAVGDFNGDGVPELAVTANYQAPGGPYEVLLFLTADTAKDDLTGREFLTGQFYADFGTKRVSTPNGTGDKDPAPLKPYVTLFAGGPGQALIEVTALSRNATHDVVLVAKRDAATDIAESTNKIASYAYVDRDALEVNGRYSAQGPQKIGEFDLGHVDRNRELNRVDSAAALPIAFTVLDYNDDGFADVVAITGKTPGYGYLVGSKGSGDGAGAFDSRNADQLDFDNAGAFFGRQGYEFSKYNLVQIRALDGDGDGDIDDVAIFGELAPADVVVVEFRAGKGESSSIINSFGSTAEHLGIAGNQFADVWYPNKDTTKPTVFWAQDDDNITFWAVGGSSSVQSQGQPGYRILAGDGGNAIIGNGGKGGGIGSGSKLDSFTVVDPFTGEVITNKDLFGSVQFAINGNLALVAGKGGDGFAKGGKGGGIVGVVSRGEANVTLQAGDGGRGVSAAGGEGGSLAGNSIYGGLQFYAGNGGDGFVGGKGGSVIGNGSSLSPGNNVPDTKLPGGVDDADDETDNFAYLRYLRVHAGDGGNGTRGGGAGGSIVNFRGELSSTYVEMRAGHGGSAVAGVGGDGGSIKASSPVIGSTMSSDLALIAGNGGGGVRGGVGGTIKNFILAPESTSNNTLPSLVSVIAGHGGGGTQGNGGRGGDVIDVNVPTQGSINTPVLQAFNYNRVLAGNGGSSAGGNGGSGGDIKDVTTSVGQGAYALVAGAGGHGLRVGGKGGNVLDVVVSGGSTSTLAKILVVAGAGGDASSLVPNVRDNLSMAEQEQKSFGGAAGKGGDGGSIIGFDQTVSITAHVDLIAGNGGSSLHYGSIFDKTPAAGRGGSVKDVALSGDAGSMDPAIALKSYNKAGQTMASWVEGFIRNNTEATMGKPAQLTDASGNVGVVVGAAGRIKAAYNPNTQEFETQPATFPKRDGNGSLIDFQAAGLASAVAGSIDRIAVIRVAAGVNVTKHDIGADKGTLDQRDYLDANGNRVATPVREGSLIDGALVANKITNLKGQDVTLRGRVFPI